jgi:hypothetical protein
LNKIKIEKYYSPIKALEFFELEATAANLKSLLNDLLKFKIYYSVKDKSNRRFRGYFRDIKHLVPPSLMELKPQSSKKFQFVDINEGEYKNIFVDAKYVNKDKSIKASSGFSTTKKELLYTNRHSVHKVGSQYCYQIGNPHILEVGFKKCEVSSLDLVRLYFESNGKYSKPKKLKHYDKLLIMAKHYRYEELKTGMTINEKEKKVFFNNVFFKITAKQLEFIRNVHNCYSKNKRILNSNAFLNMKKQTRNHISTILGGINKTNEVRNLKENLCIRQAIKPVDPKKTKGAKAEYKVDIPDYW